MDNHLRDFHQLKGQLFKLKLAQAVFVEGEKNVVTVPEIKEAQQDLPAELLAEKGLLHPVALADLDRYVVL